MASKLPYYKPPHQRGAATAYEGLEDRLEAKRFYASVRWRRVRASKLRADPLCEVCLGADVITPAEQVHHRRERRTHPELAFDADNLESVCIPCHNRKRAKS